MAITPAQIQSYIAKAQRAQEAGLISIVQGKRSGKKGDSLYYPMRFLSAGVDVLTSNNGLTNAQIEIIIQEMIEQGNLNDFSGNPIPYLTTYVVSQSSVGLPSQTGHAGEYLTTDGVNPFWAPVSTAVTSVFGRVGAVVAVVGDYTAAQVTNAVDATGSYANPAWITSLAWGKITGTPTTLAGYGITDALSNTLASANILVGNVSNVATAVAASGDLTLANTGAFTIANSAVTYAKIQNMTTNRLLGRGTAGSGVIEEITLGTGLSLAGTTLNASAISGLTINRVPKATSATTIGDSNLGDDGTNIWVQSGKYITSQDVTKSQIDLGTTGSEWIFMTTDGGSGSEAFQWLHPSFSIFGWGSNNFQITSSGMAATSTGVINLRAPSLNIGDDASTTIVNIGNGSTAKTITIGNTTADNTIIKSLLKYVDGNQGAAKVLTSDVSGNATWQTPSASGGTVTSVSVVTAQGVSGSVANPTTTPAITLTLGALTGVTSLNGLVVTANTGDITTGSWAATVIPGQFGGTGVANTGFTITLAGNLVTTGAFNTTFAASATGTYTLPTATSTLLANSLGLSGGTTLIGGTATTDTLKLRATSGVGTTNADIIFQVGNNGATEAGRITNAGNFGIGMTPVEILDITKSQNAASTIQIKNGTAGASAQARIIAANSGGDVSQFGVFSSSTTAVGAIAARYSYFYGSVALVLWGGTDLILSSGGSATERWRVDSTTGNFSNTGAAGTSYLHLKAGTATAGTAPTRYTAGILLTAISALATEVNASGKYQTNVNLNRYAEGGVIADFITTVDNGTTVETDLYTYTTKANTLAADGEKIEAWYSGTFNDLTATSQLKIYFAGTAIADTGVLTVSATGGWSANVLIIRTSSTTARTVVTINTPGASTALYTSQTDLTGLTLSGTNIIKITGTAGGASGGTGDISAKLGTIYWYGSSQN